ncbi:hypothetical protein AAG906_003104 [Vitis piasezkii]
MTPEVAIRRPMVTQPPIEGNLDCRARPFHSELCFDIATFRIQPELRESFRLLSRHSISPMSQHVQRIFEPGLTLHRVTSFILCLEGHPHTITS